MNGKNCTAMVLVPNSDTLNVCGVVQDTGNVIPEKLEDKSESCTVIECDTIVPEFTTGTDEENITAAVLVPDTHSETVSEYNAVQGTNKCVIPEELEKSSTLVVNEEFMVPECETDGCQQVQLSQQNSVLTCIDLQPSKICDEECSTIVVEQMIIFSEDKCVRSKVDIHQQAEDVSSVDMVSMSTPCISEQNCDNKGSKKNSSLSIDEWNDVPEANISEIQHSSQRDHFFVYHSEDHTANSCEIIPEIISGIGGDVFTQNECGSVEHSAPHVDEGTIVVLNCGTDACQQKLCYTAVEEQGVMVTEAKCMKPIEEKERIHGVTRVYIDAENGPMPSISGIGCDNSANCEAVVSGPKANWCGAMELVVLSSVGEEEEKFTFIESDNEMEEVEQDGMGGCEEGNNREMEEALPIITLENDDDNKIEREQDAMGVSMEGNNRGKDEEISTVDSDKDCDTKVKECEQDELGGFEKGEIFSVDFDNKSLVSSKEEDVSNNAVDNCDYSSDDGCTFVKREGHDVCDIAFVPGVDEKEDQPTSKRPRIFSDVKKEVGKMEKEIVHEGLQGNDLIAGDGSETLLHCLPTESASLWPILPNAPPCRLELQQEGDNGGGSPPDNEKGGSTYPGICDQQTFLYTSGTDNQLVPEECFQNHNQLVPHEGYNEHRRSYSLYSDVPSMNKSLPKVSNSLKLYDSLPLVQTTALSFEDQVTPCSPQEIGHQSSFSSCFEKRCSKLSRMQGIYDQRH